MLKISPTCDGLVGDGLKCIVSNKRCEFVCYTVHCSKEHTTLIPSTFLNRTKCSFQLQSTADVYFQFKGRLIIGSIEELTGSSTFISGFSLSNQLLSSFTLRLSLLSDPFHVSCVIISDRTTFKFTSPRLSLIGHKMAR